MKTESFTTRQVAEQLAELAAAAQRIASGDLGEPIAGQGDDGIGELARALEDIRVSLAARRLVMKLRTRELSVLQQTALAGSEARDLDELVTRVTDQCHHPHGGHGGPLRRRRVRGDPSRD